MKYRILKEDNINYFGRNLYRIQRISDNLLGGYIESEDNLSQDGECFIFDNAKVFENAKVKDNAKVRGNSKVYGNSIVSGRANIHQNAQIFRNAIISGHADVCGIVCGDVIVTGNARIDSHIYGSMKIDYTPIYVNGFSNTLTFFKDHVSFDEELHTYTAWFNNREDIEGRLITEGHPRHVIDQVYRLIEVFNGRI